MSNNGRVTDRPSKNRCSVCGKKIRVMAFKGTGVCSEDHRKIRDNDAAQPNGPRY